MRYDNLTTLIYITRGDKCLFIRKTRKGDMNLDKYLGIGGHFESDETAEECVLRELSEEAAIPFSSLREFSYRGLITFISSEYPTEYMHVFSASVADLYASDIVLPYSIMLTVSPFTIAGTAGVERYYYFD